MTNNELKYLEKLKQKKYRDLENKFLIEGVHLIEECLKSNLYKDKLEKVIVRNDFDDKTPLKNINSNVEIIYLDEKKFNKLSETVNSQGIIGLVNKNLQSSKIQNQNFIKNSKNKNLKSKIIIALDNINDPGNLGTILRTSYWFGVDEVLISKNSADIFNSKVIRSSQGAIFHLKIKTELDLKNELIECYKKDLMIFITDAKAENTIDDLKHKPKNNAVIVFGNEANGISKEILENKNYTKIKVQGSSECESLNITVSAGIVLNEFRNHLK